MTEQRTEELIEAYRLVAMAASAMLTILDNPNPGQARFDATKDNLRKSLDDLHVVLAKTDTPKQTGLLIEYIRGACPTQAEGTINGVPFYFRYRWGIWQLGIGEHPVQSAMYHNEGTCFRGESVGIADGIMEDFDVIPILSYCAKQYEAGKRGVVEVLWNEMSK